MKFNFESYFQDIEKVSFHIFQPQPLIFGNVTLDQKNPKHMQYGVELIILVVRKVFRFLKNFKIKHISPIALNGSKTFEKIKK